MTLPALFFAFLQIGAFSVGGGYAAMPLIENQICTRHCWLSADEFAHLVTIAEMTPGPIAINAATFVGIRIAGLPGAVTATLGCILPSCLIVSLLAWLYRRYKTLPLMRSVLSALRPVVVALIAGAGLSLLKNALWQGAPVLSAPSPQQALLFTGAFLLLRRKACSPILTMASCGVIYLLFNLP